jgi:hypothetical protein
MRFLFESILGGIIFWIIGTIIFSLTINKLNNKSDKPWGINLAFFMTGVILYIICELTNKTNII